MARTSVQRSGQALARDYRQFIKDTEKLLQALGGELDERTGQAKEQLQESLDQIKSQYSSLEEQVEEKVVEHVRHTDQLIRDYPYQAAGIALGFGFLAGVLMGRRG